MSRPFIFRIFYPLELYSEYSPSRGLYDLDSYNNLSTHYKLGQIMDSNLFTYQFIINSNNDTILKQLRQELSIKPSNSMEKIYTHYSDISLLNDLKYFIEINRDDLLFKQLELLKQQYDKDGGNESDKLQIFNFIFNGDRYYYNQEIQLDGYIDHENEEDNKEDDDNENNRFRYDNIFMMMFKTMDTSKLDRVIQLCGSINQDLMVSRLLQQSIIYNRVETLDHLCKAYNIKPSSAIINTIEQSLHGNEEHSYLYYSFNITHFRFIQHYLKTNNYTEYIELSKYTSIYSHFK